MGKIKKWSWKSHGKIFCQVCGNPDWCMGNILPVHLLAFPCKFLIVSISKLISSYYLLLSIVCITISSPAQYDMAIIICICYSLRFMTSVSRYMYMYFKSELSLRKKQQNSFLVLSSHLFYHDYQYPILVLSSIPLCFVLTTYILGSGGFQVEKQNLYRLKLIDC